MLRRLPYPQVELLTELASIAKRLAADEWGLQAMVACDMPSVLSTLLQSTGEREGPVAQHARRSLDKQPPKTACKRMGAPRSFRGGGGGGGASTGEASHLRAAETS